MGSLGVELAPVRPVAHVWTLSSESETIFIK